MSRNSNGECWQHMAEYRLTPAAERDLEAIWIYTAGKWHVEQADRYLDILAATFAQLAQAPETALRCDPIRPGYRRWSVERHVVYLRIVEYGIEIVRVLHERMDPLRHL